MSVQATITDKLIDQLKPIHLEVMNESNRHNVPKGSETHFKLLVVSTEFEGNNRVNRHRKIHDILATELKHGVHALTMTLLTPNEYELQGGKLPASPPCMGGSKSNPH